MKMFDQQAVVKLNNLTRIARNQIEEAIRIADVPVSITGLGSMFRIHLRDVIIGIVSNTTMCLVFNKKANIT